jgi:hypothetical protein
MITLEEQRAKLNKSLERLRALGKMIRPNNPPERAALLENLIRSQKAAVTLGEAAVKHQENQNAKETE